MFPQPQSGPSRPLIRNLLAIAILAAMPLAHAGDNENDELRARIAALEQRLAALEGRTAPTAATADVDAVDQRLRVVERKQELQAEADATRAASAPVLALADKGLSVKSANGDLEVKVRGLIQGDFRHYGGATSASALDSFLLRRVEPTLEGSWGKLIGFRINAQLAGDSASINDAYVDLKFDPRATVRVGKFKPAVGLERLQSSNATSSIELGLPSELAPGRDIGAQLQGDFSGIGLGYAVGLFNGAPDGRDGLTTNPDGDFELAARVFIEPWRDSVSALSGLGFGLAGSRGDKHGTGNNFLPRYRTPGQVQFFNYRSTVLAAGEHTRLSPQAYYYGGRLGLLAEYIDSKQDVRTATGDTASLNNSAWQVVAGWVLTGEDASYRGVLKPAHAFTLDGSGWGALELVGRYGHLSIDEDAFPLFADAAAVASSARSWGLGLNWYLNSNVKLVANYARTAFDAFGTATPRKDEQLFFTRAQLSF
ncbi:MAG: porin [Thermomonas sp.]|uniref:porin n=1 Tax=Thermomonas sp. TaxID=1971895 RepID=UPI0039E6917E